MIETFVYCSIHLKTANMLQNAPQREMLLGT